MARCNQNPLPLCCDCCGETGTRFCTMKGMYHNLGFRSQYDLLEEVMVPAGFVVIEEMATGVRLSVPKEVSDSGICIRIGGDVTEFYWNVETITNLAAILRG